MIIFPYLMFVMFGWCISTGKPKLNISGWVICKIQSSQFYFFYHVNKARVEIAFTFVEYTSKRSLLSRCFHFACLTLINCVLCFHIKFDRGFVFTVWERFKNNNSPNFLFFLFCMHYWGFLNIYNANKSLKNSIKIRNYVTSNRLNQIMFYSFYGYYMSYYLCVNCICLDCIIVDYQIRGYFISLILKVKSYLQIYSLN